MSDTVHAPWRGRCTVDDEPWPCPHVRDTWALLDEERSSVDHKCDGCPFLTGCTTGGCARRHPLG